jgi:hypothetical protein
MAEQSYILKHTKTIRSLAFFLLSCFIIFVSGIPVNADTGNSADKSGRQVGNHQELILKSSYKGGKLYQAGKFHVLVLNGSYQEMGRQYGKLYSAQMKDMYDEVLKQYDQNKVSIKATTIQAFSSRQFKLYPERFRIMAQEMSGVSGLGMEKIAVLNSFFDYFLLSISAPADDGNHCAAMTLWGKYTKNGKLIMGRNFDFPAYFRNFDKYLTLVVYNPTDGSIPTAVLTYPGQIASIQVFNSKGLILENNNGSSSGDPNRYFGERTPFMAKDLAAMMDSRTIETLDVFLKTAGIHYPLIYNVASPSVAYCYEMTTGEVKRRQGEDGLLIGVNHFVNPEWKITAVSLKSNIENSQTRYCNLKNLAEKHEGQIDPQKMMEIFDVTMEKGGATPEEKSIYQYVALPGELKIWIKARGYSDWTFIDLKSLFAKQKNIF